MSLRTRQSLAIGASLLMVATACSGTPAATGTPAAPGTAAATPTTATSAAPGDTSSPGASQPGETATAEATSAAPSVAGEQTLTYAIDGDISFITQANADVPSFEATQFLYSGLYTYDETLSVVPDLATELAEVTEDGLTWTLTLVDNATFASGNPVTAADVVDTYEMANSGLNCRFNPSICFPQDDPETTDVDESVLKSVTAVDESTVEFVLTKKNATFPTVYLTIGIEEKAAIDASWERFKGAAAGTTTEAIDEVLTRLDAEIEAPTGPAPEPDPSAAPEDPTPGPSVNYEQFVPELEGLLTAAGVALPDRARFTDPETGTFDNEGYVTDATFGLRAGVEAVRETLEGDDQDARAGAFTFLDYQRDPSGAGPFKLEEFKPGESLTYVRNEGYHKGAPQIERMFLPIIKDDVAGASALKAGQIDWKYSFTPQGYDLVKDDPNLNIVEYPDFGYFGLYFNLHPAEQSAGGYEPLFLDKRLRQAVELCFDKAETVRAATTENGVPVASDVPPASWAYNPDLVAAKPRDVAAANALLDEAGWTMGSDNVRTKDGRRLETKVYVRAGRPDRISYMQLLRDQVAECGIKFNVTEGDFTNVLLPLLDWPHIPTGDENPYDAYFGGFSSSFDPDPFSIYHSSECTSKDKPSTFNYICWQNDEVDRLIEQGLEELDQAKRAEIYKQISQIVADELPVIYAWADVAREGLAKSIGPGNFAQSPTFFWEIEKLTNQK